MRGNSWYCSEKYVCGDEIFKKSCIFFHQLKFHFKFYFFFDPFIILKMALKKLNSACLMSIQAAKTPLITHTVELFTVSNLKKAQM